MNTIKQVAVAALAGAGMLVLASSAASARVVCNEDGECWHVQQTYQYQPGYHVIIHNDDWRWKEGEKYRWREHEGRGYWHGDTWMTF